MGLLGESGHGSRWGYPSRRDAQIFIATCENGDLDMFSAMHNPRFSHPPHDRNGPGKMSTSLQAYFLAKQKTGSVCVCSGVFFWAFRWFADVRAFTVGGSGIGGLRRFEGFVGGFVGEIGWAQGVAEPCFIHHPKISGNSHGILPLKTLGFIWATRSSPKKNGYIHD